jgi:hypothetical protein
MLQTIVDVSECNVNLLENMLKDVPPEHMCHQPPGLPNHPTWQVGHMATVRFFITKTLETPADFPEAWLPLFSPQSVPTAEAARYPQKDELIATFKQVHRAAVDALKRATPSQLGAAHGIANLNALGSTVGLLVSTTLTMHDGLHLGQLSDWRRVMGLPRALW